MALPTTALQGSIAYERSVSLNPLTVAVEALPAFSRSTDWLESRYTNADSRFRQIGDSRVHYRVEGQPEGRTLVLLHGTYSSLQTWDKWVDALRDEFRLVRLDMPGFGLTGPRSDGEHTLEYLVETVGAFCAQLDVDDLVLVGNSLGGGVAWRVATEHPDLVDGVVLLNAGGVTLVTQAFDSHSAPIHAKLGVSRMLVRLILADAFGAGNRPSSETVKTHHDMLLREGNREATRELSRTFRRDHPGVCGSKSLIPTPPAVPDPEPNVCDHYDLGEIQAPVLFQWGEEDTWLPLPFGKKLASQVPQHTFLSYEGAGHMLMEELPTRTAADARQFVRDLPSSVPSDSAS